MFHAAHKIRLYPNQTQQASFTRCAGARRFWYNWGLERWQKLYEAGEKVNDNRLRKELTQLKRTDEFSWAAEIPQAVTSNALRDLGVAFKNFFRRVKNGESKVGYPQFKKRGFGDGFSPYDHIKLRINNNRIYIRGTN